MKDPWEQSASANRFESFCEKILLGGIFVIGLGVATGIGKIGPEMLTAWLIFVGSATASAAAIGINTVSKKFDIRLIIGATAFTLIYGTVIAIRVLS